MTLGERIKHKREELGLTQIELANRMGYKTRAAICNVEKGDDNLTTDRITKFAVALGVSESYLMGWEEDYIEKVNTDTIVDIVFDRNIMKYVEMLMNLSEEHKKTVCDTIEFLHNKEK